MTLRIMYSAAIYYFNSNNNIMIPHEHLGISIGIVDNFLRINSPAPAKETTSELITTSKENEMTFVKLRH